MSSPSKSLKNKGYKLGPITKRTRMAYLKKLFSSKWSFLQDPFDYETINLRKELVELGYRPGPITKLTKPYYLKIIFESKMVSMLDSFDYDNDTIRTELKHQGYIPPSLPKQGPVLRQRKEKSKVFKNPPQANKKIFSVELQRTLQDPNWTSNLTHYKNLEKAICEQFNNPDPSIEWRGGIKKTAFTYLLLDSSITNDLPNRANDLTPKIIWETFLSAIFYIGMGQRSRPYAHITEAAIFSNKDLIKTSDLKQQIDEIWKRNGGVICLFVFQNIIPVEAYTREASMLEALQRRNLSNIKRGHFYGVASQWSIENKRMLGVYLLHKALQIFLQEGERQLGPKDVPNKS